MTDKAYDRHAECRRHLEELVFDIFLLGEGTSDGAFLLTYDEEDGRYGSQNGRVKETKREELALNGKDEGDKEG